MGKSIIQEDRSCYLCGRMTALGAEMTAEDPDHVVTGREPARLFAEE